MMSSNFVGRSIGRSPGLAPLRMRSTKLAERRYMSRISTPYDMRPPSSTYCRNSYQGRQPIRVSKLYQGTAVGTEEWTREDVDRLGAAGARRLKRALELAGLPNLNKTRIEAELRRSVCRSRRCQSGPGVACVPQQNQPGDAGDRLGKELHLFGADLLVLRRDAGDVSTWARKARHKPGLHRINQQGEDHDRDCILRLLSRSDSRTS